MQLPQGPLAVGMQERVWQVRAEKHVLGTMKQGPRGRQDAGLAAVPLPVAETGCPALILAALCPLLSCGSSLEFPKRQPEPRMGWSMAERECQVEGLSPEFKKRQRSHMGLEGGGGGGRVIGQLRLPAAGVPNGEMTTDV